MAALEALARATSAHRFGRPQTPGRIIEDLARAGLVTPTEADFLPGLAQERNRLARGGLDVGVSEKEIRDSCETLDVLIDFVSG